MTANTFSEILKFNENHDSLGRFASSGGGGAASPAMQAYVGSLKPAVEYPERVEYWKQQIQAGNERPILVSDKDENRVIDGNHTLAAYQELGKTPKVYAMDRVQFLVEASEAPDTVEYIKQAIKDGKATEVQKGNNFTIYKADDEKRLVFGWASVIITVDGEPLEDRQHDLIDPEDLEEAAYEYVLNFRDAGEEHLPGYRKRGKLVESCVLTPDKQKAMGIPPGILPVAWWIGFKIEDDDTWERVKNGTYRMFSIEGKANREPVEKGKRSYDEYPSYDMWLEENLDATLDEQKAAKEYYSSHKEEARQNWKYAPPKLEKADQPTGCGVLVVRDDGKILTGTRIAGKGRGTIGGPGGHIEEGETPEEAAKREAFEEFGIRCRDLKPIGVLDGGDHGVSAVFVCTDYDGEPAVDDQEMSDLEWRDPAEITEPAFPPFKQSLELLKGGTMRKNEPPSEAKTFSEILKFNPFHDSQGKFSSSHGFKTYSANPKTKAGQMAISRSAAAGHGYTMNVHRESKGENIAQNDRWIRTGRKPLVPAANIPTLQQRAARGTRSTPAGQQQAKPKPQQQAKPQQQQQATNNPPNGTQSTQGSTLAQSVAGVNLTSAEKLALVPRNRYARAASTQKAANDHDQERVAGKDISKTFQYNRRSGQDAIDAVAEAQGWKKAPTVTNDLETFQKAAVQSGRVMLRTLDTDYSRGVSADALCKKTMTDGSMSLGGGGGKVYGSGMYVVDTSLKGSGSKTASGLSRTLSQGQQESACYGNRQMMATVRPDAKIATPSQAKKLASQFSNLSMSERARFGYDTNAYIASKGYDGAKWHSDSDPTAYTTIFNQSALIFYGGVANV